MIVVLALLLQSPSAGGIIDQGTFVIRADTQEVGRETFRVLERRSGDSTGGWLLDASTRWTASGHPVVYAPVIDVSRDSMTRGLSFEATGGLLESQVVRDGDAAHVPDLEIEDHELGNDIVEGVAHVLPSRHFDHFLARADERSSNLVADPLRVGSNEDRGHGRQATWSRLVHAEQERADRMQRSEVVDVVREIRHIRDRSRVHLRAKAV